MLTALMALVAALSGIGGLLIWFAVRMGLTPLDKLRREVESRRLRGGPEEVPAVPLTGVPREAAPFVSALNDLLAQLNRAMTVQRQFTADASHQLRTPVAILRCHLDLLDRQPPGSAAWRTSRTDIAAVESKVSAAAVKSVDLVDVAREAAADLAGLARRQGIELSFEAEGAPRAMLDPRLQEDVLRNLIDNAMRYSGCGGLVCVRVRTLGEGAACIEVEDDGPGIPEEQRARVFERFHRLERSGDPGGSGLGLAIVRAFTERLRGSVSLHDGRGGRGLLTRVTLAATPPVRAEQPLPA